MPCSLRPWTTTGLVLTSAGVIAVSPISATVPPLDIGHGSVQLSSDDTPFPLVDWTQFSANATTNLNDLLTSTPDFSGLSNPAFYNLATLLIEGGMAAKIASSPTAVGTAIAGVINDIKAGTSGAYTDALPTILNAYLNGIASTDGLLTAVSATPPPYESGNLVQLLVQTITDQSSSLNGDQTLVPVDMASWATSVPTGETAGGLYLDIPTAISTLTAPGAPLNGVASFFGLSVSGDDLDMNLPTAVSNLIAPGAPLNDLGSFFGLSVSGDDLDVNLQTAIDDIWPPSKQPSWFAADPNGVIDIAICGEPGVLNTCTYTYSVAGVGGSVDVCSYLPSGECPTYGITIGNPSFPIQTGDTTMIADLPPTSLAALGDNYTVDVPQYDLDLAKDLLALIGQPTDLTVNLDLNSVLPASLGLSIAGGNDLQINVANVLAELLNVFFSASATVPPPPPPPPAPPNPLPLVDWTQFSANTTTNLNELITSTPDFSGLSNPAFYNLATLLIEGGMALKIASSPTAAGTAIAGVINDIKAGMTGGYTNALPTILNAYLNGLAPTDGLLTAVSATPPPYESGNLLQLLVQTITDESSWLSGDQTPVPEDMASWAASVPAGETAGGLYLDIPTAISTLTASGDPLNGAASFLGLFESGDNLEMSIPTFVSNLIAPGGPLYDLGSFVGLSVSGDDLDINLQTAIDDLWPSHPAWFAVDPSGTIDIAICGGSGVLSTCDYTFAAGLVSVEVCSYLPSGECPIYSLAIGNPSVPIQTGDSTTVADWPPPVPLVSLGDNYTVDVPQYDLDLAKDLLALFGQPTDLAFNLDLNSVLPASLGLSIAGGDDLQINVANILAELLNVFFPAT